MTNCNYSEHTKIQRKEIQKEIEELQEKLKALEEKSPAEEAYKEVYGWYPPTTSSVSNYEDNRWSAFQNGYNASQEPEKEQNLQKIIDKMVEERKSQKLWNMVRNELGYSIDCCDEIVDLVEKWLPNTNDIIVEEGDLGWNRAITTIKGKLR